MTTAHRRTVLDRYADIGELSEKARRAIRRLLFTLAAALGLEAAYLGLSGRPGAAAFALVATGTCVALGLWARRGIGLPLLPIIILQNLVIYGVPIAAGHEVIAAYPPSFVLLAGREVLIFDLAIILAWAAAMQFFRPSSPPAAS